MSILQIVENFNKLDFSFIKTKADISFLTPYKNKKILMIGYSDYETKLDSILNFNIDEINRNIDNYDLFVISHKISCKNRKTIQDIIRLFSENKKNYIFYGYSTYLNLNLDNSRDMFRPIDITKEPFNVKNYKKLNTSPCYYYLIQYTLLAIFSIYLNIKYSKFLYKILIIIVILFAFLIPFKNILYIKNNEGI